MSCRDVFRLLLLVAFIAGTGIRVAGAEGGGGGESEVLPGDRFFARFKVRKAPVDQDTLVRKGDRIALCGDSITEIRNYTRVIESYLAACHPELEVDVRQFGWSGETAAGFRLRMTNDVLRFRPTLATLCYGMNDHGYRPYQAELGVAYRESMEAVIRGLQGVGARVIAGSPGCVGQRPPWVNRSDYTDEVLNLSLNEFRGIALDVSRATQARFADVFLPMLLTGFEGRKRFGPSFLIAGTDGVHPGWAGGITMAHVFLKAMGVSGDLGAVHLDLASGKATGTGGHRVVSFRAGGAVIESERYPYCAVQDRAVSDQPGPVLQVLPFFRDLSRFMLILHGCTAKEYRIVWENEAKTFKASQLEAGINLAEEFGMNPFVEAFAAVDQAVVRKQIYETRQVKTLFHGDEGRLDMDGIVAVTEKVRAEHVKAIRAAVRPVRHTLLIRED